MRKAVAAALIAAAALTAAPAKADGLFDRVLGGMQQGRAYAPVGHGQVVDYASMSPQQKAAFYGYRDWADYNEDVSYANRAQALALGSQPGRSVSWMNPRTGNHGAIRVVEAGTAPNGRFCRVLAQEVVLNGRHTVNQGVVCEH